MAVYRKSEPVGLLYIALLILFVIATVVLFFSLEGEEKWMALAFGIIFILVDGVMVVQYLLTPVNAIILNADRSITLPGHNVTLPMATVTDISYRRASARGIQYKWGKVIIKAGGQSYTVRFLRECETVCKNLTREMFEYRNRVNY